MNAVEFAIKMEADAVAFYRQCADRTNNPIGRKMFLSIAEDEQYHIACAKKVAAGESFDPAASSPKQDMKTIYEQNKDAMQRLTATADEIEALKIAMKMEKEGADFYRKAAAEASSPAEKAFFECLMKDEEEHFAIFQNTCNFLSDTGNWFMWEEKGIVEG
ncbi:MAG TPA: ferritin family protein [Dissulfurispiraceae bacterium]|nr:ferritin family protein [Dissulfurispiraceae bacterium]